MPGPRTPCLADQLVERPRTNALRERRDGVRPLAAASLKRSPTWPVCSPRCPRRARTSTLPILPGDAPSDYERYIHTEELLALQKGPDEWVHRDELLFQVVHQSSELWLKLATSDVEEAARLVDGG